MTRHGEGGSWHGAARTWLGALRPAGPPPEIWCTSAAYDEAVSVLGGPATQWVLELAGETVRAALQDRPGDAEYDRAARSRSQALMLSLVSALHRRLDPTLFRVSEEHLSSVRSSARVGSPIHRLLRMITRTHLGAVDALTVAAATSLPPKEAAEEARAMLAEVSAYLEVIGDVTERTYEEELALWSSSAAAARRSMIDRILARQEIDPSEAESVIDYLFDGWHTAVLLSAPRPTSRLEAELSRLGGLLKAQQKLTIHQSPATIYGWLRWAVRPGPDLPSQIRAADPLPEGMLIAVGPAAAGVDGFRWTHLAAREAERLRGLNRAGVVDYAEVRVPALLTTNAELAARMALDVLGPLCSADAKARRLRETVSAFLATGRSRNAAAEQLHVSTGTVAYRVRQVEEIIGTEIDGADRTMMAALEVMRAFDAVGREPATITEDGPLRADRLI